MISELKKALNGVHVENKQSEAESRILRQTNINLENEIVMFVMVKMALEPS